jgi:hypothetical protein
MTKLLLSIATASVLVMATAVGQSTPETDTPGTQASSPSMAQGASASGTGMQGEKLNGEKKLKGCIQSQGGSYMLQEKSGKSVMLTGADISAHVGHEVAVHGTWESGTGASSASSTMGSKSGKQFDVKSVDMISDSCRRSKRPMGTQPSASR